MSRGLEEVLDNSRELIIHCEEDAGSAESASVSEV